MRKDEITMCNATVITFGVLNLSESDVKGKKILEVGSLDVNGSLRYIIESWKPAVYVGADIEKGPGVDVICNAEDIANRFGENSFDVVISTELLEHVKNWQLVISNIKRACKPNGIILITTRAHGYPYHAFPNDYWRYGAEDMKELFSDCIIKALKRDTDLGIYIKAVKPANFKEKDLSNYKLHSIRPSIKFMLLDILRRLRMC